MGIPILSDCTAHDKVAIRRMPSRKTRVPSGEDGGDLGGMVLSRLRLWVQIPADRTHVILGRQTPRNKFQGVVV